MLLQYVYSNKLRAKVQAIVTKWLSSLQSIKFDQVSEKGPALIPSKSFQWTSALKRNSGCILGTWEVKALWSVHAWLCALAIQSDSLKWDSVTLFLWWVFYNKDMQSDIVILSNWSIRSVSVPARGHTITFSHWFYYISYCTSSVCEGWKMWFLPVKSFHYHDIFIPRLK